MAKRVTTIKTKTTPKGKTRTTTVKDTSKKTGKMLHKETMGKMSNQAAATAISGEAAATAASTVATKEREATKRAEAKYDAVRAAIDQWNGVINSQSPAAEGTGDAQEGTTGSSNWTEWF